MKIKTLYVNGDSFAFGQELDGPRTPRTFYDYSDYQRANNYGGVISSRLDIPNYINNALPGGSNQRVYRTMLDDVTKLLITHKPEEIFVNISLTGAGRREYYYNEWGKYYPHIPAFMPKGNSKHEELWNILTRNWQSDKDDQIFNSMIILGMQNFLRINKIPYLLTSSMNHGVVYEDEEKYNKPEIKSQYYQPRYYNKPSFSVFCYKNHYAIGPEQHPLTEGHKAWALHLLEHITSNNLLDNSDLV